MKEDPRCCGSGTCIIDSEGHCWCGQQWDGEKLRCVDQDGRLPQPAVEAPAENEDAA